jgi:Bifunctional DNA primase/polymerase, N-terminal
MINGSGGAYDVQGPFLRTRGYYVHPIIPATKRPGYYVPSENRFVGMENWNDARRPMEKSKQPGAGIGLRCGLQADGETYIGAVDYDRDDIALKASEDPKLWGLVRKVGQRGATPFFRSKKPILSGDYKINGQMAVQILGEGKQTVIPGSIHPDTGKPYEWDDDRYTLYNCNPADLPEIAEDLVERIEALLKPFGWEPEPEPKPDGTTDGTEDRNDGDTFQALNNAALQRLEEWVPQLGLYGLRSNLGGTPTIVRSPAFAPRSAGRS